MSCAPRSRSGGALVDRSDELGQLFSSRDRVHHGLRGHASCREQRARALYRPLRKSAAPATAVLRSTSPMSGLMASKRANEEIGVITPSTSSMPTWKSDGTVNRISEVSDPGAPEKMSRSNVVESRDPTR